MKNSAYSFNKQRILDLPSIINLLSLKLIFAYIFFFLAGSFGVHVPGYIQIVLSPHLSTCFKYQNFQPNPWCHNLIKKLN